MVAVGPDRQPDADAPRRMEPLMGESDMTQRYKYASESYRSLPTPPPPAAQPPERSG
ncbi:hypothetical protein GCM10027614_05670 [Micromonospora vulcania]